VVFAGKDVKLDILCTPNSGRHNQVFCNVAQGNEEKLFARSSNVCFLPDMEFAGIANLHWFHNQGNQVVLNGQTF